MTKRLNKYITNNKTHKKGMVYGGKNKRMNKSRRKNSSRRRKNIK